MWQKKQNNIFATSAEARVTLPESVISEQFVSRLIISEQFDHKW